MNICFLNEISVFDLIKKVNRGKPNLIFAKGAKNFSTALFKG